MQTHLVILAGLGDSGIDHWQSHWLDHFENSTKVIQDNWIEPQLESWLTALNNSLNNLQSPTVLVAHSLAVTLIAHWASQNTNSNIVGALLVAPADVDSPEHTPPETRNFSPIPLSKINFPTILVCSENDPYISIERAQFLAQRWGSDFVNIGQKGHINSASNLKDWQEGQLLLQRLLDWQRTF